MGAMNIPAQYSLAVDTLDDDKKQHKRSQNQRDWTTAAAAAANEATVTTFAALTKAIKGKLCMAKGVESTARTTKHNEHLRLMFETKAVDDVLFVACGHGEPIVSVNCRPHLPLSRPLAAVTAAAHSTTTVSDIQQ